MKHKGTIFNYLFLSLGFVLIFIPLYMTVLSSFKETNQITGDFFGLPHRFTLDNFQRLLSDGIGQYFFNSMLISVVSIALITFFVPLAAFSIARNISRKKAFALMYSVLDSRNLCPISSYYDSDHHDDDAFRFVEYHWLDYFVSGLRRTADLVFVCRLY